MLVKRIGEELSKREGRWSLRGFLSENDKAGFREGDAEAIAEKPYRDGVYDGLEDSVGTVRIIRLEVDAKVVNENGFEGVGNDREKISLIAMINGVPPSGERRQCFSFRE